MAKPKPPTLGDTLRTLREAADMSVQELATAAELPKQTVYDLEQGRMRNGERVKVTPTWDTIQAIATALQVSTDVFRD